MPDLWHEMGSDLVVSANGDVLTADSVDLSDQRILRRLLTNAKDYIWQPSYGAGLPQKIGDPFDFSTINAIVTGQMYLEATVLRDPPPTIDVSSFQDGMFVALTYTEADSDEEVVLGFPVTNTGDNV